MNLRNCSLPILASFRIALSVPGSSSECIGTVMKDNSFVRVT